MVWIVTGNLNHTDQDTELNPVPSTSHYLRPDRQYRLGRHGYTPMRQAKDAADKVIVSIKPKPYDFRIKSSVLSKDWNLELKTGEWTQEQSVDKPDNPANSSAYSLVLKLNPASKASKKYDLVRDDQSLELEPGVEREIRSGDRLTFLSGWRVEFLWSPIILAMPKLTAGEQEQYPQGAKVHGFKIAKSEFMPHHTHLIMSSVTPSISVLGAALAAKHITSPAWLNRLISDCQVPLRPADAPVQKPKETLAKYEERLALFMPSVGSDYERYWSHSNLERDWESKGSELDYCVVDKNFTAFSAEGWCPNPARSSVFSTLLGISWGASEKSSMDLFQLGGGNIYNSDLLDTKGVTVAALIKEVERLKALYEAAPSSTNSGGENLDPLQGQTKILFFQPQGMEPEALASLTGPIKKRFDLLTRVAAHFGTTLYVASADIVNAVYQVEMDIIFLTAPPPTPYIDGAISAAKSASTSAQQSLAVPATGHGGRVDEPQPSGSVSGRIDIPPTPVLTTTSGSPTNTLNSSVLLGPNSHPWDSSLPPGEPHRVAAHGGEAAAPPAPIQRKLTRRAKPVPYADSQTSYATQAPVLVDLDSGSRSASASLERMEEDPIPSAPRRTLKRRAPTTAEAPSSEGIPKASSTRSKKRDIFESDSSDDGAPPAKKSHLQLAEEEEIAYEERKRINTITSNARMTRARSRSASPGTVALEASERHEVGRKSKGKDLGAVPEEEEEQVTPGDKQSRTSKRAADAMDQDSDHADTELASPQKKVRHAEPLAAPPSTVASKKATSTATNRNKNGKAAPPDLNAPLFQVKASKRKGAELEAQLANEFNALKLVKPVFNPMVAKKAEHLSWDDEDEEEELMRMIREDRKERWNDDDEPQRGFFRIVYAPLGKIVRRPKHAPDAATQARWALMPNFKKFRPKGSGEPAPPKRVNIPLVLHQSADFGIGRDYADKPKVGPSKAAKGKKRADSDDDSSGEDHRPGKQTTLNFKPVVKSASAAKPAAKRAPASTVKGKGKQVVADSEEDDEDVDQLADDMEVDTPPPTRAAPNSSKTGKLSSSKSTASKASPKITAKPVTATAARKKATMMINIESSDEDDDGATFKGFGKKPAATAGKRK